MNILFLYVILTTFYFGYKMIELDVDEIGISSIFEPESILLWMGLLITLYIVL